MARFSYSLAIDKTSATDVAVQTHGAGVIADVVPASTYAADKTAFEAALAVLVADGASPTQAHVTTANNDYTTFKADLVAPPATADVIISFDASKVVNKSTLYRAIDRLIQVIQGSNSLSA
jgi:hypothetical protein